jgi:TPR repeat protein
MPETDAPEQDACHDQISEEVGSEARTSAREREAEITRERGRAAKSAFAMFLTPPSDTTAAHIFNFELGGGPPAVAAAAAAAATAHSAAATAAAAAATAAAAVATAAGPETDLSPPPSAATASSRWFERYRKEAEQGRAGAQYKLGTYYETGQFGLDKDEGKAEEWYRKASAQGNAPALRWL